MAITYPVTLPTTPTFNRATFTLSLRTAINASEFTFQQQVVEHQGAMWRAVLGLPPMPRETAEPWLGALLSLNGYVGTFYLADPFGSTPRGIATGTPLVNGATQTGRTLNTKGWTINITGILKAGDWIQIGTSLHKVVQDANSDGTGLAVLEIQPRLRSSPAADAPIIVTNAKGVFRLADAEQPWQLDTDKLYNIAFGAIESLP